ncbi:MAG TPA: RsmE family RNA methyltransferase [Phycisphaerae bacterium]|jgi:16S rRNA (uracil1498-N3)-methyltransferase|nr:RsmE family RNA methyltransferase [Phycisphaerae bacterium]
MLRLYCPNLEPGFFRLPDSEAAHALKSRRLRAGDSVVLFNGRGAYARARLCPLGNGAYAPAGTREFGVPVERLKNRRAPAVLAEVTVIEQAPPPTDTLELVVAGCKGPRLDWLVEKCTELGVTRLVLAEFERSVVRVGPTHVHNLERTAIEACKQCGRLWLPEISAGLPLSAAIGHGLALDRGQADSSARRMAFADPAATLPLGRWLESAARGNVTVVVGPEGGLTPAEIDELSGGGAQAVRLAEHVLRVETAAIAVASVCAARLSE